MNYCFEKNYITIKLSKETLQMTAEQEIKEGREHYVNIPQISGHL
mgnify:CR=1 FL=1